MENTILTDADRISLQQALALADLLSACNKENLQEDSVIEVGRMIVEKLESVIGNANG